MVNTIYEECIELDCKGNGIKIMNKPKTLKEAIETKSLPQYKRKLTKKTVALLEVIARNLPSEVYTKRLAKVNGQQLIDDGATNIGEEEIAPTQSYTVFESVKTKVNHLKRLKEAWKMKDSPFHIILYGFSYIDNEYKNEWVEIINEVFKVEYPPAYLDEEDNTREWDAKD